MEGRRGGEGLKERAWKDNEEASERKLVQNSHTRFK